MLHSGSLQGFLHNRRSKTEMSFSAADTLREEVLSGLLGLRIVATTQSCQVHVMTPRHPLPKPPTSLRWPHPLHRFRTERRPSWGGDVAQHCILVHAGYYGQLCHTMRGVSLSDTSNAKYFILHTYWRNVETLASHTISLVS